MRKKLLAALLAAAAVSVAAGYAASGSVFNKVDPFKFDPGNTHLVQGTWLSGIGCPTNARVFDGSGYTSYTAGGCPTGDPRDSKVEGLLLVKTGPTANVASAGAVLEKVQGISPLNEVGYDIRKEGAPGSPIGSHCGAGAPRFNITTTDGVTHFIGCNSPPGVPTALGDGWSRLRWDPLTAFPPVLPTDTVKSIAIVMDDGQDTGPDFFGAAILDNVEVNGVIVGQGDEHAKSR